jgi:predicted SAM-dependent methyltransferase
MNALLKSFASRLLSAGEFSALRHLVLEFRISRNHRCGLRKMRQMSWSPPLKLNLGSGAHCKEGYLNVDMFPGGDLTLDLRRGLPFESNCCEEIFSEHCLEHFDYPHPVSHLLQECLRVLKPSALLRFSVPDTEWALLSYAKGPAADYFQTCKANAWHPNCETRLEHINHHFRQGGEHRFAYDEETAKKLLQDLGFQEVKRVSFDGRIDSQHREIGSLFISARKPAAPSV